MRKKVGMYGEEEVQRGKGREGMLEVGQRRPGMGDTSPPTPPPLPISGSTPWHATFSRPQQFFPDHSFFKPTGIVGMRKNAM